MKKSLFLLIALLFVPSISEACSPPFPAPTAQELLNRSDAVFVGKILTVDRTENTNSSVNITANVQVDKYWKGDLKRVIKLTSWGYATCAPAFGLDAKGQEYLIYAAASSTGTNTYSVGFYDIKTASTSAAEISALGQYKIPQGGNSIQARFDRNLTVGSEGSDVSELQTFLESLSFLKMPNGVAKGYFGQITRRALMEYQKSVGIFNTGFFGPLTRAKLNQSNRAAEALKVLSPNGGEKWMLGSMQKIHWQDSGANIDCPIGAACHIPAPRRYDIKITQGYNTCTGTGPNIVCTMANFPVYTIAKNVVEKEYDWKVGTLIQNNFNLAPGSFYVEVYRADGTAYDRSDAQFDITVPNITN